MICGVRKEELTRKRSGKSGDDIIFLRIIFQGNFRHLSASARYHGYNYDYEIIILSTYLMF